jgi:hypothetical protein
MVVGAAIASSRNKKAAAAQSAAPAPQSAAPAGGDDSVEQLKKFAELKDQGILTQEEFDAKKKQILGL